MSAQIVEKKKRVSKKSTTIKVVPAQAVVESVPEVVLEPAVEEVEQVISESLPALEGESASDPAKNEKVQKKRLAFDEVKSDVEELLNRLLEDIEHAKTAKNKELLSSLKVYEKYAKRIRGNTKKLEPKDKRVAARTQPSGFNKPLLISAEIAEFAGWSVGEKKSRTDVTIALCEYVRTNSLQQQDCRKFIIPDKKLTALLRYDGATEKPLTYSTMQKYIGHLFVAE